MLLYPSFTRQYASTPRRGAFLSLFALMVSYHTLPPSDPQVGVGVLLTYSLGSLLPWRATCLAAPVLLLLMFGSLLTVPESPVWLLGHRLEAPASSPA